MELTDFYRDLEQEVVAKSEVNQHFSEIVFAEEMTNRLIEAGEIVTYDACHYKSRGLRVDGYCLEADEGTLSLFICDYRTDHEVPSLTKTDSEAAFKRLENFYIKSLDRSFHEAMEESSYGFRLAHEINLQESSLTDVKLYLLSNADLSTKAVPPPEKRIKNCRLSCQIWDLSRFYRMEMEGRGREDIVIDLKNKFGCLLPCLPAHVDSTEYESYLAVFPGRLLADIYGEYGQRLLEQNVRTFLQFRGKVNKGIRSTIINEPDMFFAYNNGITATAESVEIESGAISSIKNLQIVNGGQTTASILGAAKAADSGLNRVFVQMKLSIVDPANAELIVPKISEYANTQNRVNAADFFSNHPFHIRIEDFSRRLWAPSSDESQRQTHWFYERARGQYMDAQGRMTNAERRQFKLQNPRNQMFTKTDLAKFEMTWDQRPHTVSLGAQKNFAIFASEIGSRWNSDNLQFNEQYFKDLIAKAILFRRTEKLVMEQSWYQGGYRANVVTYTLAILSRIVKATDKQIDFTGIWRSQKLTDNTEYQICLIAEEVHEIIQDTPANVSNVTEWCKKEACWKNVQRISSDLDPDFEDELIGLDTVHDRKSEAKAVQKVDNGIEAQAKVVELGPNTWSNLLTWNNDEMCFSPNELGIIQVASRIPNKIPTDKQSRTLLKLLERAVEEGFYIGN